MLRRTWSYTSLRDGAEVIAARAQTRVVGIPALEQGIDRLKQIAIGAIDAAQEIERLSRPTRWEHLEKDSIDLQGCTRMPTPLELELLELAAQQRRRTTAAEVPQTSLPALTPEMLLSASARSEMEAARRLSGQAPLIDMLASSPEPQRPQQVRVVARQVSSPRVSEEIELGEDMGDLDLDSEGFGQAPQVTTNDDMVLNSLFMGREAQEARAVLGGDITGASGGYDIEYDADSMLEGRTAPNEAARFQIGRQAPPRMPFSARMASGPSDGVVVSSRGSGGWQAQQAQRVAAAPRPVAPIAAPVPRPRPAPARPVPPPAQIQRMSRFEHITRGGGFDDD